MRSQQIQVLQSKAGLADYSRKVSYWKKPLKRGCLKTASWSLSLSKRHLITNQIHTSTGSVSKLILTFETASFTKIQSDFTSLIPLYPD